MVLISVNSSDGIFRYYANILVSCTWFSLTMVKYISHKSECRAITISNINESSSDAFCTIYKFLIFSNKLKKQRFSSN